MVVGLILLNGIFSGAEIAIVSVRRSRLAELTQDGNRRARAVERLRADPDGFFATVQIGITVVGATAAAFGGSRISGDLVPLFTGLGLSERAAGELALVLVIALISYLSLVFGELVPKSLGLRYAERYATLVARPLVGLGKLARPLVWFLTFSSNLVLRFFGDRTTFSEARMSAEELQQLVEDAARQGSVDTETGEIASRAFQLEDVNLAAVMVPRNQMVTVRRDATFEELKMTVLESGHARIPVRGESLDEIVGYIVSKDLLSVQWGDGAVVFEDILRPAYFVPETMKALDALRDLRARRALMAIVVDERGMVAGLVTVEDLVEELVGEIVSEHELPDELVVPNGDGRFVVQGGASIRDVNRALSMELPEADGYTTVGGLCIALAGRIPSTGDRFIADDGSELEVLDATPRRVRRVAIRKDVPAEGKEEEGEGVLGTN
ncbi:MAG: HlyC/CorC family transporter [Myxococcaceae bacterium]|nr:HlyC/CorC family transporter [Myxococcaceae bacterium]